MRNDLLAQQLQRAQRILVAHPGGIDLAHDLFIIELALPPSQLSDDLLGRANYSIEASQQFTILGSVGTAIPVNIAIVFRVTRNGLPRLLASLLLGLGNVDKTQNRDKARLPSQCTAIARDHIIVASERAYTRNKQAVPALACQFRSGAAGSQPDQLVRWLERGRLNLDVVVLVVGPGEIYAPGRKRLTQDLGDLQRPSRLLLDGNPETAELGWLIDRPRTQPQTHAST